MVKPGEVLALGFAAYLSDAEADRIVGLMKPFKDRGIEVVIITGVNRMVVTQPVDNPVDKTDRAVYAAPEA